MRRALALAAAVLAAALLPAAPATASSGLRTGIADDGILLFSPERAPEAVARWRALGVDTVRVHVRWVAAAPGDTDPRRPAGFDARDHEDPQYDWKYLDRALDLLALHGLEPMLAITGSGPLWTSRAPDRGSPRYKPDPEAFGDFAHAVARRYGHRVRQYLIWNEPNQPLWLQPQSVCPAGGGRCVPEAPHLYRELFRSSYAGIHGADPDAQVIAGTLSPRGVDPVKRNVPLRPLRFLRTFACVDGRGKRVRTGGCRGFRPVTVDGFAHHAHGVLKAPDEPSPDGEDAALGDLARFKATLDELQDRGGFRTPTGRRPDLHLTEYGYQTNPPDTYDGVSRGRQRDWLQHATYLAWKDPRVRTIVQYAWRDEAVRSTGEGRKRFSGWQSGLLDDRGRAKPALEAFAHPFWAEPRTTGKVRFWGQVRPGARWTVGLQRRSPSGTWVTIATTRTNGSGAWTIDLAAPRAGRYRYRYSAAPFAGASGVLRVDPVEGVVLPAPPRRG